MDGPISKSSTKWTWQIIFLKRLELWLFTSSSNSESEANLVYIVTRTVTEKKKSSKLGFVGEVRDRAGSLGKE